MSKTDDGRPDAATHATGMGTVAERLEPEQQVAYWRRRARYYEQQVQARGDYDEIKAAADRWREHESSRNPDRLLSRARAEGAAQARWEALEDAVVGIVTLALQRDGRAQHQVDAVVRGLRPGAFIGPAGVDGAAVKAYLEHLSHEPRGAAAAAPTGDAAQLNDGGDEAATWSP